MYPKFFWKFQDGREWSGEGVSAASSTPRFVARAFHETLRDPLWSGFPTALSFHPEQPFVWKPETLTARCKARIDQPTFPEWEKAVQAAQKKLQEKGWDKIVLARKTTLLFDEPVSPVALFDGLNAFKKSATLFYFSPEPGVAFLGATPELLYHRHGDALTCEALAGTFREGDTDLLKRMSEFSPVKRFLIGALTPLCRELEAGEDSVRSTATLHHHLSVLKGRLKEGIDDSDLLKVLHPTPAVCGEPRDEIRNFIREIEPFERGWYAGPIGYSSFETTELYVALRCALVRGNEVHLFAGAGIVPDSVPELEWKELDLKISHFLCLIPPR